MSDDVEIKQDLEDGLSGKMLIAMPSMGDPRFEKTLIYIIPTTAPLAWW